MLIQKPRRRIPAERLPALVPAATRVFCRCGYGIPSWSGAADPLRPFSKPFGCFVPGLRHQLPGLLAICLESRARPRQILPRADWTATAGLLIQTMAWANHQRPFDPGLSRFPEDLMEAMVVPTPARGLLAAAPHPP